MQELHVHHVIPSLEVGGAERLLLRVATSSVLGLRHSVTALGPRGPLSGELEEARVPVAHLGLTSSRGVPLAAVALLRRIRQDRPDVVHTWMPHANLLGGAAGKLFGVPVVWSVHHSELDAASGYGTAAAVERLNRALSGCLPGHVVFTSRAAAKEVGSAYRARSTTVIRNAAPAVAARPDARQWLRRTLGLTAAAVLVGIVGRDHPQKDQGNYIAAAARLARTRPDVQHVLVGRGLTVGSVWATRARGAGLVAHLLGERSDVLDVIAGLDVLVSSSAFGETAPLVLTEALSQSVPVVATDVGDSRDLVGPGGIVVPRRNPAALACALERLLGLSPEMRQNTAAAGRSWALLNYSQAGMLRAYTDVYQQAAIAAKPLCRPQH